MGNMSENRQDQKKKIPSKHICMALLAHVDAGKTTLSEGILYKTGCIRRLGRVDHGDAYFDTDSQERARVLRYFPSRRYFLWADWK